MVQKPVLASELVGTSGAQGPKLPQLHAMCRLLSISPTPDPPRGSPVPPAVSQLWGRWMVQSLLTQIVLEDMEGSRLAQLTQLVAGGSGAGEW